ncbi:hypothetical protein F4802DRAFT_566882, partial [Xylaria palmicola]
MKITSYLCISFFFLFSFFFLLLFGFSMVPSLRLFPEDSTPPSSVPRMAQAPPALLVKHAIQRALASVMVYYVRYWYANTTRWVRYL